MARYLTRTQYQELQEIAADWGYDEDDLAAMSRDDARDLYCELTSELDPDDLWPQQ